MNYDSYRTLAATCASKCKGLSKAKGFITDGEENLQHVFEDELKGTLRSETRRLLERGS